jgi:plasmid stabilization system protein ParE
MKVVLSARVEADIADQLQYGIDHFGQRVAERTFSRVDTFLFKFLPAYPYSGNYLDERRVYEVWIARTPFVIFYRVDGERDTITVLALFHHAQNWAAFDPDEC